LLRYKTETRPGLVALYDIQPVNGAGQFLQPGAHTGCLFAIPCQLYCTFWLHCCTICITHL